MERDLGLGWRHTESQRERGGVGTTTEREIAVLGRRRLGEEENDFRRERGGLHVRVDLGLGQ